MNAPDRHPPQPAPALAEAKVLAQANVLAEANGSYLAMLRAEPALAVVTGTVAAHMMIMGLLLPVLPLYAKTYGVSEAVLGLVITAFGVGRLLVDIPAGLLAEKLGRRALMLGGPLLIAAGALGCALTDDFGLLVAFRFLQGLGAGAYMTVAGIVCADVSSPATRPHVMALYQTALVIGAGTGPALGGWLAGHYGYVSAFWVSMAIGLASAALSLLCYRETKRPAHAGADHSWRIYLPILASTQMRVALMASLGFFLTRSSAFMQLLPLLGLERFRLGPGHIGIGFALMAGTNLVLLPIAGRLVSRWGTVPLVVAASVGLAAGMAGAALTQSIVLFYLSMIVLGVASSLEGPSLSSFAVAHAPNGRYGPAMGAMRFAGDAGFVVGPVLLGALVDHTTIGYRGALLVASIVLLLIAITFLAVARERPRNSP